jgi:hypothetical protein
VILVKQGDAASKMVDLSDAGLLASFEHPARINIKEAK